MFICIQNSKEIPILPNKYKKLAIKQYRCAQTDLLFNGDIYETADGIFILGDNALFISRTGRRYFYDKWHEYMQLIGFYKHYIIAYKFKDVYALSFNTIEKLWCSAVKSLQIGKLSIIAKFNIIWGIYPWNYRICLAHYLTASQRLIILTAHLTLKRRKVVKNMRHMICKFAFTV